MATELDDDVAKQVVEKHRDTALLIDKAENDLLALVEEMKSQCPSGLANAVETAGHTWTGEAASINRHLKDMADEVLTAAGMLVAADAENEASVETIAKGIGAGVLSGL